MDKEGNTSYVSTRYKVPPEYKLATELTVEHGGKKSKDTTFKFYKNPNALGLGVAAKGDIEGVQLGDDDPFDNQNKLFSALTGSDEEFFTPVEVVKSDSENMVTVSTTDGHIKYSPADESNKECHIDYVVRMNRDSDLYMYLPTKYERSCNIWYQPEEDYIDGEYKMEYVGQFFTGDNYSIMKIGRFIEGQDIRVRITVANDENEAYWRDKLFYTFDYEGFSKACDKLKESSFEVTEFEDTALTGSVKAQFDGQKLFTTIPFEEGWSIEVNGKAVTPEKCVDDSLIAIPLDKGENVVKMRFSPAYWRLSQVITIFGVLVLLVIMAAEYKNGLILKKLLKKTVHEPEDKSEPSYSGTEVPEPVMIEITDDPQDEKTSSDP